MDYGMGGGRWKVYLTFQPTIPYCVGNFVFTAY